MRCIFNQVFKKTRLLEWCTLGRRAISHHTGDFQQSGLIIVHPIDTKPVVYKEHVKSSLGIVFGSECQRSWSLGYIELNDLA